MKNFLRFFLLPVLAACAFAQSGDTTPAVAPVRVTENVKVKKMVEPVFPAIARQKGIQGRVVIDVTVTSEGKVKAMQPISGEPVLVDAFKDALKKWRFEPQLQQGQAIPFITRVAMTFGYEGTVSEKEIKPPASPAAPGSTASASQPPGAQNPVPVPEVVRVSSGVAAGNLIHKVAPIYPPDARNARISGTVIMHARIGKDGLIHDLTLVSGPPELSKAAMGAVEQWRYRPYLFNGNPVEVQTTIQVNFNLGR
jgi:TonB family protein